MMTQHTHGPWSYEVHELSEGFSTIVYDERGHAIADHLAEDRARLIAAAPELLAALTALSDAIFLIGLTADSTDAWMAARAAIAKATAGGAV